MHVDITERVQSEERIRQSEGLLTMAGRIGRLGAWSMGLPSLALTWSDEVRAIHEVSRDYAPTVETGIEFYAPECRDAIRDAVSRCIDHGTPFDLELQIITANRMRLWVRAMGEMLRDASGDGTRIQGAFQDITERKLAEAELSRINRALKMLSKCNESLIRAEGEQELLDKICSLAVDAGGYRMAWVGYVLEDDSHAITPVAHAGVVRDYFANIKISSSPDDPGGKGPTGRTVRSGQVEVCDDVTLDPGFAPFLSAARERGYCGVICLPLRDANRTFGVLGLYSAEVKTTSAAELTLLLELANDLAFGLINLRERAEKRRVETAVLKIAASVSAASDTGFFEQLARSMAEAVGAQAAFVAEFLPGEPLTSRTVAAVADGKSMANFDYAVKGTPCEILLVCDTCVIARDVANQLPPGLEALRAEGYVGRRLDSSTGHALGQLSVVFREPLKETSFINSTIDIFAARAASELERRETDSHVREQAALLDNARDAIIVRGLDYRVLYWNLGAQRLYGWTADEAMGHSVKDLLFDDPTAFLEATGKTLDTGGWVGELRQVNKAEQAIVVEVHWSLVRDTNGMPKSILCINTDITERKKMEDELFRAQRLESVGTLASGLAHDLNNILAPIMMCAPLLRQGLPPKEAENLLATIEMSAERGAQIVRKVLTFGRGVQGERKPLRIDAIIHEIVQIAEETFPKNIRIQMRIADDLSEIMGDATQWHQVMMNLSVNARDAMPEGGVLRFVANNLDVDAHYASMAPGLSAGPHIVIEVSDTGTGIPPRIAERIFDPFFTTKPVGKGTGLGLSTVIGIVKNHGGIITLDSQPGSGTTFRIIIPATLMVALADPGHAEPHLPQGSGQTVLIADDEEAVRKITCTILEKNGYRTLVAADGIEALALCAQDINAIDLVLTDIEMPRMDGITLIRTLRRMLPALPVIASTGRGEIEDRAKLAEIGVGSILRKPYKAENLLLALDAELKAVKHARAIAGA